MHKTDPELVTVAEVEVGITELLQLLLCWGLERWAELAAAAAALATAEACTTLEVKAAAVAGAMDEVRAERCEEVTFFMCFFLTRTLSRYLLCHLLHLSSIDGDMDASNFKNL